MTSKIENRTLELKKYRLAQKQQALYGFCHKYNKPIEIPGLEAFKCGGLCGWVARKPENFARDREAEPTKVISLIVNHNQPKSFVLLGLLGGEA